MAVYPVTASMGQREWCPACQKVMVIYVMVIQGELLTCCATCQRIIERRAET